MDNVNLPEASINWFGHASFYFIDQNGNKIYFVDPFQLKDRASEKADLIFITHAHSDHFSPDDIDEIIHSKTTVIAPPDILEKIDIEDERKIMVEPNNDYEIKGFKFQTIPAYNNHPDKLNFHPKSNNWVGFIFELNGKKIYHAGDADFIEEMKKLKDLHLDIAMLPIGGTYTMGVEEAARAANAIAAKTTIPMHYKNLLGGNFKQAEEKFKSLVTNSNVLILNEIS
jgi:L-ascorbate metabolism protein UlaG (beta-lactamase superfamily)